jgi:hypothetical protein
MLPCFAGCLLSLFFNPENGGVSTKCLNQTIRRHIPEDFTLYVLPFMTVNNKVLSREVKIIHCEGNVYSYLWFLYYNQGFRLALFYGYSLMLRKVRKKKAACKRD